MFNLSSGTKKCKYSPNVGTIPTKIFTSLAQRGFLCLVSRGAPGISPRNLRFISLPVSSGKASKRDMLPNKTLQLMRGFVMDETYKNIKASNF